MKKTVYSLVLVSSVLAGAQVVANQAPAAKNLTVKLKTHDGRVVRCDVRPSDVGKVSHLKRGEIVMMEQIEQTEQDELPEVDEIR